MPYSLGNKEFKSKKEITSYFVRYRDSHEPGTTLTEPYRSVMIDLVKWHPEFKDDWVCSLTQFKLGVDYHNRKNYTIDKHGDGNYDVFSFYKCISMKTPADNHRSNVIEACRVAITPSINYFRRLHMNDIGEYLCDVDKKYYRKEYIHVDHHFELLKFSTILNNWLSSTNRTYGDIKLVDNMGHFLTESDTSAWVSYHDSVAILRCIHKKYNLTEKY